MEKLRYHPEQARLWTSNKRFRVVPAGRRSGKTELSKRRIVKTALEGTQFPDSRFFCAAPTRDQAKRIFWNDLKRYVPRKIMKGDPLETLLMISLLNNSEIHVLGMDKPERIEGTPWDGGILDEYGNMKPETWPEHVRPALADRQGWCWMIGVPEGRNHYFDLYTDAKKDTKAEWDVFEWFSADILPPEEIEQAKEDLDPLTFEQEFEGKFITFEGRAYYTWDDRNKRRLGYDSEADLIICLDFNVSPGVAALIQEEAIMTADGTLVIGQSRTCVFDEVYIKRDSNTPKVCQKIIDKYGNHEGDVYVYGDATGGSKGTGKIAGSDWDLVKECLYPVFEDRLFFNVPKSNPGERQRINAMNSRIRSISGARRLFVDPVNAPMTVRDLEGVRLKVDGSGEIDKKKDKMLSHLTDGIGYYVAKEFPIVKATGGMVSVIGL